MQRAGEYSKNDLVKHKLFGFGRVLEVTKSGKEQKLKINFGGTHREILASFVGVCREKQLVNPIVKIY